MFIAALAGEASRRGLAVPLLEHDLRAEWPGDAPAPLAGDRRRDAPCAGAPPAGGGGWSGHPGGDRPPRGTRVADPAWPEPRRPSPARPRKFHDRRPRGARRVRRPGRCRNGMGGRRGRGGEPARTRLASPGGRRPPPPADGPAPLGVAPAPPLLLRGTGLGRRDGPGGPSATAWTSAAAPSPSSAVSSAWGRSASGRSASRTSGSRVATAARPGSPSVAPARSPAGQTAATSATCRPTPRTRSRPRRRVPSPEAFGDEETPAQEPAVPLSAV